MEEAQKQTEKLANVVYYVTNENKKLCKKYDNFKEKLKAAIEVISQFVSILLTKYKIIVINQ